MSPELALLTEVWETVKPQVAAKERAHIAEDILRSFDEHVGIEDILEHVHELDSAMKTAVLSHYEEEFADDDEDDDWG